MAVYSQRSKMSGIEGGLIKISVQVSKKFKKFPLTKNSSKITSTNSYLVAINKF